MSVKTPGTKTKKFQTPREVAVAQAANIVALRAKIDADEKQLADLTASVVAYVEATGETELEVMTAVRRANPVKMVGDDLTPKELEYAKSQLCNELPDFVKTSLDVTGLFNAFKTNHQVSNALTARGLRLVQDSTWSLKVVKQ